MCGMGERGTCGQVWASGRGNYGLGGQAWVLGQLWALGSCGSVVEGAGDPGIA